MTSVVDRPTTETRPPAVPDVKMPLRPKPRGPQMFRWLGWLLLVGAVAAVTFFVIQANTDDGVDVPTVAVNADPGAITADPTGPGAINADPKPRTPVFEPAVGSQIVEDATVSPLIYSSIRQIPEPNTSFPEESTINPSIYWP